MEESEHADSGKEVSKREYHDKSICFVEMPSTKVGPAVGGVASKARHLI
jgi:hypothetical protein